MAALPGKGLAGRLSDLRPGLEREQALVKALQDAEARSAGKSRFLANLSHELRTPLNAIMGFADTMRQGVLGPLPDRYRGYADLIHESGELLLELISDVLDMARVEAERFDLNLEVFDVREAASAVIRLVRGQVERAGLEFVAPDLRERIEVRADRRALKQMSLNLISNAIKATPPGGRVAFGLAREGEDLVLVVEDTGCGVAEADLARLGRPFEQAGSPDQKAAGAGLGLSLVKALCDLHGGEMTLSSREGQGTRVSLRLPIVVRDQVQPELDLT
jgi:cell cycle sensor histidine kinase DivJ